MASWMTVRTSCAERGRTGLPTCVEGQDLAQLLEPFVVLVLVDDDPLQRLRGLDRVIPVQDPSSGHEKSLVFHGMEGRETAAFERPLIGMTEAHYPRHLRMVYQCSARSTRRR